MKTTTLKGRFNSIYSALSYCVFALLFFIPVILIISNADSNSIKDILSHSYYKNIFTFSLFQAFLSALFSLILGIPGAWIITNLDFPGKKAVKAIYSLPFILPSILVVLGFVIFYGNSGFLSTIIGKKPDLLYRFKAVIMAHVFYNFPVVITMLSDAMSKLDRRIEESAQNCGAGDIRIFVTITLPRLLNSILSSFLIIFLFCFTSFSIVLILGGGPSMTTIEVEIYRLARISLDIPKAASLSLISVSIVSAILFLQNTLEKKSIISEEICTKTHRNIVNKAVYVPATIYVILSVLFIACPVISVIIRSFMADTSRMGKVFFSLNAYKNIDFSCLTQTFFIAVVSSAVAVILALGILRHSDSIITMLPLVVSSAITGLGYLIVGRTMKGMDNTVMIILAHSVISMPFAMKSIKNVYMKIPEQYKEIACIEGVSQFRYFTEIEFPILRNPIISSFLFCFCLSCGELNATIILGNTQTQTIPMQIKHMISSYDFQGACAWGTILIILSFILFYAGEKLKESDR